MNRLLLAPAVLLATSVYGQSIRMNQIGYYANEKKTLQAVGDGQKEFSIKDAKSKKTVYSGKLGIQKYWEQSGEKIQTADFTDFKKEGEFYVEIGGQKSYPFKIGKKGVYEELNTWILKAFYLWRASTPIEEQFATFHGTSYARALGHPDDEVYYTEQNEGSGSYVEKILSTPKGWYDAGDYNKYTVNAGFSCEFFAILYDLYPEYYNKLDLNIPESGNGVPDLLNELKWELDWMMTMQDEDGGVFNKTTTLSFSRFVMPEKDKNDRHLIGKTTTAALNFAASMAMAHRIFKKYDNVFPGYADKALSAGQKAFEWAEKHPDIVFRNPRNVFTGSYSDERLIDEFQMAAAEMLIATKDKKYVKHLNFDQEFGTPVWHNEESMQLLLLAIHQNELKGLIDTKTVNDKFIQLADRIYNIYKNNVGMVAIDRFRWGSNCEVSTNGAIAGIAYRLTGDKKYLETAIGCFDYLLGRNATGYCFISRFGSKYPKQLHDRRTQADGIAEPLPGYLCGGPNAENTKDCGADSYPTREYPAKSYLDEKCSYSTNEIAINWNAPLALLTGIIINELEK